jgi:hypothetical protein
MLLKSVFFVFLVSLAITCGATDGSAPGGWLEGHLSVVFLKGVDTGDEMSRQTIAPGSYAEYPLIVLTADRKQQVARLIPDDSGHYRAALQPGNYVIDVEDRVRKRLEVSAQPLTIAANQTAHVDITVITGLLDPAMAQ